MDQPELHAHQRGKERLNLNPESINTLQKAVDRMWFSEGHKKLTDSHYHVKITDPNKNLLGYAALKRVNASGKRPRLILATILGKHMKPRGSSISHFLDLSIKDNDVKMDPAHSFKGLGDIPNNIDKN